MTTCSSQGAASRLAIGGYQFPFISIKEDTVQSLVDDNDDVITGLMDALEERVSIGPMQVGMRLRLHPTPKELTKLFPYLGLDLSSGLWVPQEDIDDFTMLVDRIQSVDTYTGCKVDTWTLSGKMGAEPCQLDLIIRGKTWTPAFPGAFAAAQLHNDGPYPFAGGVSANIRYADRKFNAFAFTVQHFLQVQMENQLTANCIDMTRRRVTLATSHPWIEANTDLVSDPLADADGHSATLLFSKGNQSTAIDLLNLKEIVRPADIPAKVAERLPYFARAYRSLTAPIMSIEHDDTP